MRKLEQHGVQLAGVQGTHFGMQEQVSTQAFWVQRHGFLMSATLADKFGSFALV